MRLNEQEKMAIREAILGEDPTADICLFGSRLDDARQDVSLIDTLRRMEKCGVDSSWCVQLTKGDIL